MRGIEPKEGEVWEPLSKKISCAALDAAARGAIVGEIGETHALNEFRGIKMEQNQRFEAHFGEVTREGNIVTININFSADRDTVPVEMRVLINAETGQIIGDATSVLAFFAYIQLPLMGARGMLSGRDGHKAGAAKIEKVRADITKAINTIDHYERHAGDFVSKVGVEAIIDNLEAVFPEVE